MKCNIHELALMSHQPCVIEGRLNYKKVYNGSYRNQSVFKERWFRLINNYLFYFKISEMGTFDTKHPAGVFVMENSSVQMEHGQSIPFSFSISFIDEADKKHVFAARTEDNVVQWVIKLRECSYEYLRSKLHTLQSKIYSITGKDPLLMVPRNDGACLWAPSIPFSTVPACSTNSSSFSCHLHTHAFTLERSKSDVQTFKHHKAHYAKKPTFYTDDHVVQHAAKESPEVAYSLDRSKTSAVIPCSTRVIDTSIFDTRPAFSRAAPSPPIRKKSSPGNRRVEINSDVQAFTDLSKTLASNGIFDQAPVPPKRKSPKFTNKHDRDESNIIHQNSEEDLIKL